MKMVDIRRLQFTLGLAQKAGRLVSGDFAVRQGFHAGEIKMLFVAKNAAPNTKKDLQYLADKNAVPVVEELFSWEMGRAIGKGERMCAAIKDGNFLKMVQKCFVEADDGKKSL